MISDNKTIFSLLVMASVMFPVAVRAGTTDFLPSQLMEHFNDCQYYERLAIEDERSFRQSRRELDINNALSSLVIAFYDAKKGTTCDQKQIRQELAAFFQRHQSEASPIPSSAQLDTMMANFAPLFDSISRNITLLRQLHVDFTKLAQNVAAEDKLKVFVTIAYIEK